MKEGRKEKKEGRKAGRQEGREGGEREGRRLLGLVGKMNGRMVGMEERMVGSLARWM